MYAPLINGRRHTFGVSGLLWKRNLLLYDRETDSLWSQLLGKAVAGPLAGTPLRLLASVQTTWAAWRARHPNTLVLSFQTGHIRDYARDPYRDLALDRRLALAVRINGHVKIYPHSELKKGGPRINDELAGQKLVIEFQPSAKEAVAYGVSGKVLPSVTAFLADLRALYPDATVYKSR